MSTIWVLVADSARARLLEADGPRGALTELKSLVHPEARLRNQDLDTDTPGTTVPHADSHAHAAEVFARELGDTLNEGWKDGQFDRLVLAAPPRFLGLLREVLPDGVLGCVGNEVNRDLLQFTDLTELRHHLPERLCSGS